MCLDHQLLDHHPPPDRLYRTDFFPGLGWMMNKIVWDEFKPKWPTKWALLVAYHMIVMWSVGSGMTGYANQINEKIGWSNNIVIVVTETTPTHTVPSRDAVCNRYSMRPSVLCNIQARARGRVACILHKTRGFLMLCVFYITTPPYLPCNKSHTIPKGTVWLLLHACNLGNGI